MQLSMRETAFCESLCWTSNPVCVAWMWFLLCLQPNAVVLWLYRDGLRQMCPNVAGPSHTLEVTFSLVFLRMLFLMTDFVLHAVTPGNYNIRLTDGNEISMATDLPDDLYCCREGFQDPCAKRHKLGKVGPSRVSQWQGAERGLRCCLKSSAVVTRWELIPVLNFTIMDLP